jgi:hypothetical protein
MLLLLALLFILWMFNKFCQEVDNLLYTRRRIVRRIITRPLVVVEEYVVDVVSEEDLDRIEGTYLTQLKTGVITYPQWKEKLAKINRS